MRRQGNISKVSNNQVETFDHNLRARLSGPHLERIIHTTFS